MFVYFKFQVETFATETNTPSVDSVEGIMYTLNDGVIMSGEFVDEYEVRINFFVSINEIMMIIL
jgi:hypothetical protein